MVGSPIQVEDAKSLPELPGQTAIPNFRATDPCALMPSTGTRPQVGCCMAGSP